MERSRIAIDFDGVLADTAEAKQRWIERNLGLKWDGVPANRSSLEPLIGSKAYGEMQAQVGYEDTLDAKPLLGATATLQFLAPKWSFTILSARPSLKIAWINEWLALNNLSEVVGEVISTFGRSKHRIAGQIGARWLIDDDHRHFELVTGTNFILFGDEPVQYDDRSVFFSRDWSEVPTIIQSWHSEDSFESRRELLQMEERRRATDASVKSSPDKR